MNLNDKFTHLPPEKATGLKIELMILEAILTLAQAKGEAPEPAHDPERKRIRIRRAA